MGMSADEYWHGEPSLHRAFLKKAELERQMRNADQWRGGQYMMAAIAQALAGNKQKIYPDKPFPLTEKELHQKEEIDNAASIEQVMNDLLFGGSD